MQIQYQPCPRGCVSHITGHVRREPVEDGNTLKSCSLCTAKSAWEKDEAGYACPACGKKLAKPLPICPQCEIDHARKRRKAGR